MKAILKYNKLYILFLPCLIYLVIFNYAPICGIVLAFKKYDVVDGIFGSPWNGIENFKKLFTDPDFIKVTFNTLKISFLKLIFGFPIPIILSLMLNEVKSSKYKKGIQTIIFLPHFISWVILSGIIISIFRVDGGIVNLVISAFGGKPVPFLTDNRYFVPTIVFSNIWKNAGWGTIIYLAAISGISIELYEAAKVDGANRFQRILHITLPGLSVAISINLILQLSNVLNAGFDEIFNLYSPLVYDSGDIIDTYIFRNGIINGKYSMATALGLFKSVIAFILIVASDKITKRLGGDGIW